MTLDGSVSIMFRGAKEVYENAELILDHSLGVVVLPSSIVDIFNSIVSRSGLCDVPLPLNSSAYDTTFEEESITCLCHSSEHKKLPNIRIISTQPEDGLSITIPPLKYLSKPFLEENDPYNPKCHSLIRRSPNSNV